MTRSCSLTEVNAAGVSLRYLLLSCATEPPLVVQCNKNHSAGEDLAVLTVEDKYIPNKPLEALNCYGTSSLEHPGVQARHPIQKQGRFADRHSH